MTTLLFVLTFILITLAMYWYQNGRYIASINNALLAEDVLSFTELTKENPYAQELHQIILDVLLIKGRSAKSDNDLRLSFNYLSRFHQLNIVAMAIEMMGDTPLIDNTCWMKVENPVAAPMDLKAITKHAALLSAKAGHEIKLKSGKLILTDSYLAEEQDYSSIRKEIIKEQDQKDRSKALTNDTPKPLKTAETYQEIKTLIGDQALTNFIMLAAALENAPQAAIIAKGMIKDGRSLHEIFTINNNEGIEQLHFSISARLYEDYDHSKYYSIMLACHAGPLCGDGGSWDVRFDTDGEIESIGRRLYIDY